MNTIIHRADSRGHASYGWLDTWHTFSFARYYDPGRVHFGVLRVLNDDVIRGGTGFGTHPHDNMEIITIPLSGSLRHRDSMGHESIIHPGEVQVMTAGTGITHSEHNASSLEDLELLQIWIFPRERGLTPKYDQLAFESAGRRNRIQTVVSPEGSGSLLIHQDAWLHLADLEAGAGLEYQIKLEGNGMYLFVIEGSVSVEDTMLGRRDGSGISGNDTLTIRASEHSQLLLIDVPMDLRGQ